LNLLFINKSVIRNPSLAEDCLQMLVVRGPTSATTPCLVLDPGEHQTLTFDAVKRLTDAGIWIVFRRDGK